MSTQSQSLELQQPLPAGFGLGEAGRYRILRVLGQGGFGITYLALDTHKNAPRGHWFS